MVISGRSREVMKLFHHERNQAFHLMMEERAQKILVPALERIVSKGCEEGIFHTEYPHETSVAMVAMFTALKRSVMVEDDPQRWNRFLAVSRELLERLLDARPGTFSEFLMNLPPKGECPKKLN